jgi:hypothetical protein
MSSGVKNRLVKLSNQGFKPKKILDIGANVGEFHGLFQKGEVFQRDVLFYK